MKYVSLLIVLLALSGCSSNNKLKFELSYMGAGIEFELGNDNTIDK